MNNYDKITLKKFFKILLSKGHNLRTLVLLFVLSSFNYLRIISIPVLLTNENLNKVWLNFIIQFTIYIIAMIIYKKISLSFEADLRKDTLKLFLSRLLLKQEEEYTGLIPNSVYTDVYQIKSNIANIIGQFTDSLPILMSSFLLYFYNLKNYGFFLANIFIISLIISFITLKNFNEKLFVKSSIATFNGIKILDVAQDKNLNIETIISNDKIDDEKNNIYLTIDSYWKKIKKAYQLRHLMYYFPLIINFLYIILSSIFIQKKELGGIVSFILINLAFNQLIVNRLDSLIVVFETLGKQSAYLNNINKFSEYKRKINNEISNKKIISNKLVCKNCEFSYDKKNIAISIPELKFETGKITILKGHIGSGKTTLLKLIFGFYDLDKGNISFVNNNINSMSKRDWRKKIYYVPQKPNLFNTSIDNNIFYLLGKSPNINIFKELNLVDLYNTLNRGNDDVGIGGEKLSGGQKQIISLLRVIISDKDIILLDEPTSALDTKNKKIIFDLIHIFKKQGKTIIISTHDKELIDIGDKIITMEKGRLHS